MCNITLIKFPHNEVITFKLSYYISLTIQDQREILSILILFC